MTVNKPAPSTKVPASAKETVTRGHKKKARTRHALVEAAMRIYAEKGVGELLLNELAVQADVSNGTVYNYFKTREEVLQAVGIELANQFSHRITAVSHGIDNGAERVAVGVRMFIQHGRLNSIWASAVVRVFQYDKNIRSAVANNLRGDLQLGAQQGLLRYQNEEIAMALIASATIGAMTAILDGHDFPDYDSTIAEMLLLGLGLTPAKAHRIAHLDLPEAPPNEVEEVTEKRKRGRPRKQVLQ